MNIDAILRDIAAGAADELVPMLRRAYEAGYREGMAATPTAVDAKTRYDALMHEAAKIRESVYNPREAAPPPDALAPSTADGGTKATIEDSSSTNVAPENPPEEEDDDDLGIDPTASREKPVFRGIRASATVGGLLRKIERVFRLEERFDLVVRIENPSSGRALNRNVRLSSYLRHD